jgi:hypothetical protein
MRKILFRTWNAIAPVDDAGRISQLNRNMSCMDLPSTIVDQ